MGLLVWLSYIYDYACFGRDDEVDNMRNNMMNLFDCDDMGNTDKYFGFNINGDNGSTFIQPVMSQRSSDEFAFLEQVPNTPVIPGNTLIKSTEEDVETPE